MNKYNSSNSKTYSPNGRRELIRYTEANTAGFWSKDKVTFGNMELEDHDIMEAVSDGGNLTKIIYIF